MSLGFCFVSVLLRISLFIFFKKQTRSEIFAPSSSTRLSALGFTPDIKTLVQLLITLLGFISLVSPVEPDH